MCISFSCPSCSKRLKAPKVAAGKSAHCPHCKQAVTVPLAARELATEPPPRPPRAPPVAAEPTPPPPSQSIQPAPAIAAAPLPSPTPPATAEDDIYQFPSPAPTANGGDDLYALQSSAAVVATPPGYDVETALAPPIASEASAGAVASASAATIATGGVQEKSLAESLALAGRWWYLLFAFTLLPLVVSLGSRQDNVLERLERTLKNNPGVIARLQQFDHEPSNKEILALFPDGRLEGAHLPVDTWWHWVYALEAAAIFALLLVFLFPCGNTTPKKALLIAAATASGGIVFLITLQMIAIFAPLMIGGGILFIIALILNIIAFSYTAATDPNTSFLLSFIGFTLGVGLCEELTKALPVFFHVRSKATLNWQGVCYWGMASGIGFGLAEGIMYCSDFYNGVADANAYLTRFFSCVALHAIWSSAAAIMIWRCRKRVEAAGERGFFLVMVWVLLVPMVLHGLYDTCLKREMFVAALATALASFAWLFFLVELTRMQEESPAGRKRAQAVAVG
jgi:RsiW-degrading membrane proteinase PrsW (M82 family)